MLAKDLLSKKQNIFGQIVAKNFRLKIFGEGIIVGICVGLVISVFRYLLEKAEDFRTYSYSLTKDTGLAGLAVRFLILLLVAGAIKIIIQKAPQTAGSGIVQVKGFLVGRFKLKWARNLVGKFFGAILAIGAGLSLGRQGPAVLMGASVGQGVSRMLGRLRVEEKYLVTSGAGAGLAAAFNAPLAGVIFALEEMHKNFSPTVLMSTMGAALSADYVMRQFFGAKPVMDFSGIPVLMQSDYLLLLGLGICCGLGGVLFSKILLCSYQLYRRINALLPFIPTSWFPLGPLLIAGVLGYYLPQVLGGGEKLITSLTQQNYPLKFLLILLVVKFVFTMLSSASGAPGGIFLPMLVIGALIGNVYGNVLVTYWQVSTELIPSFVVLAMAALFTAVVKAPITGSILITEMTGSFQHLLPVIIVCMVAYLVSDLLKTEPIYDNLFQLTVSTSQTAGKSGGSLLSQNRSKTIIEEVVCSNSRIEGQRVKDVLWPKGCLIISIGRGEKKITPRGETRIYGGDFLYILVDQAKESGFKNSFRELCKEQLKTKPPVGGS